MRRLMVMVLMLWPALAAADERLVRLHAPEALVETGVLRHILPRFSLKTQVRVELAAPEAADMVLGDAGRALFQDGATIWHMDLRSPDHPGTQRLAEWLTSDIGQNTILSYAPGGAPLFQPPVAVAVATVDVDVAGEALRGHDVSRLHCGRCHAVDAAGKKNDIGSTPSFFVLRTFADWEDRFTTFYVLNPHGAFTQIEDVTPPFADNLPPAIVPVEMSITDLQDVLAYVNGLEPADLGAPIQHQ